MDPTGIDELRVHDTIPAPKNERIKREIARMQNDVKVIKQFVRHGPITDGRTVQPAHTNLILLLSTQDESTTVAFATNQDVESNRELKGQAMRYGRR